MLLSLFIQVVGTFWTAWEADDRIEGCGRKIHFENAPFERGKKYFFKYNCEQWLGHIRQHGNQMT